MIWVFWALGSAISLATADFLVKRFLQDLPLPQILLARFAGLLPVAFAIILVKNVWPLPAEFWWAMAMALPAEIAAMVFYMRAIQLSPLSLSMPFLAFTPLFAVGSGALLLGEHPSPAGMLGIIFLIAGVYLLNSQKAKVGWAKPFLAVKDEPGSWMMLVTAALYGFTAVVGRKAVLAVGPWPLLSMYLLGVFVAALLFMALFMRQGLGWGWLKRPWPVAGLTVSMSASLVCHMLAVEMVQASYMLAIKRSSILFATLYGGLFLGELRLAHNLGAGLVMLAGAAMIILLG